MTYALLLDAIHGSDAGDAGDASWRSVSREGGVPRTSNVTTPLTGRQVEDRALVESLRTGDGAALSKLMQRYFDPLARIAWHILGSRDAAEDVAQAVFVRLWDQRTALDPERPVAALLFSSARNRALNDRKYEQVRERYRESVALSSELSQEATTTSDEDEAAVQRLLYGLPERQQTALRLRFVEQLAVSEVAAVLGIAPNAAHQLIFRGLQTLRKVGKQRP